MLNLKQVDFHRKFIILVIYYDNLKRFKASKSAKKRGKLQKETKKALKPDFTYMHINAFKRS